MLREGESLEFLELFATQETKADMILTFLALLELIRLKRVKVYQRGIFGAIRVFRPVGPGAGARPRPRMSDREKDESRHERAERPRTSAPGPARPQEIRAVLEALVFASPQPITPAADRGGPGRRPEGGLGGGARRS